VSGETAAAPSAESAIKSAYDLVVIGAGPAGLAAAAEAAGLGLDTVLLDEQAAPGGQIYRAVTETPLRDRATLGEDYWRGRDLVGEFRDSDAQYVSGATVWSVSQAREIGVSVGGAARLVQAKHVILATGAIERPFPIPGWTLPGVMTAGAAQILLKSSGLVAQGRVVIAGSGPLLWLLAAQYTRAGAAIEALLDTTSHANCRAARRHLLAFLASPYLGKGLRLILEVARRVRVIRGVTALAASGEGRVREVIYRQDGGAEQRLAVDTLLLHHGVAPNVNLANSIGCKHVWDEMQLCWRPVVDGWGASTIDGIAIAGDGAGIAGADAAEQRGRLAALDAGFRLGRIPRSRRDRVAEPYRVALRRAERGRIFLDTLHQPARQFRVPRGDTIVCRCEEVTAQQIVDVVALGCSGPNQAKSFLRCGMGPCQGRMCGLTVTELIAEARGVPPEEVGYFRLRPPVKPITLAELAALPKSEAAVKAVARS
jgi:NADPH-dependent 2,4-dienoyl-CoA reductase/sulfur reductase-like enzyme